MKYLRDLSPRAQFWLVIIASLGYLTASAFTALYRQTVTKYDDSRALGLIAYESFCILFLYCLSRVRGWHLKDLGLSPSVRLTFGGLALFFLTMPVLGVVQRVFLLFHASPVPPARLASSVLSLPVLLLLCTVNPFFEEAIVAAYVVRATAPSGAFFAVSASAALRLAYHVYQGPAAALSVLPTGFLFAAVYWRWRRAWPLIVAHALFDLVAFALVLPRA